MYPQLKVGRLMVEKKFFLINLSNGRNLIVICNKGQFYEGRGGRWGRGDGKADR